MKCYHLFRFLDLIDIICNLYNLIFNCNLGIGSEMLVFTKDGSQMLMLTKDVDLFIDQEREAVRTGWLHTLKNHQVSVRCILDNPDDPENVPIAFKAGPNRRGVVRKIQLHVSLESLERTLARFSGVTLRRSLRSFTTTFWRHCWCWTLAVKGKLNVYIEIGILVSAGTSKRQWNSPRHCALKKRSKLIHIFWPVFITKDIIQFAIQL